MKKYWNYYLSMRFDNVSFKGTGNSFLAAFVLAFIIMNVFMKVEGDGTTTEMHLLPLLVCLTPQFFVSTWLMNPAPQFSKGLPFTAKEQVNMMFLMIAAIFVGLGLLGCVFFMIGCICDPGVWKEFCETGISKKEMSAWAFEFFYYLLLGAVLVLLGTVRDKKKWYLGFAGIAILLEGVNLLFINLLPENKGSFKTYAMLFENITTIPYFEAIIIVMGVISVSMAVGSYFIVQRLYAPKKY